MNKVLSRTIGRFFQLASIILVLWAISLNHQEVIPFTFLIMGFGAYLEADAK